MARKEEIDAKAFEAAKAKVINDMEIDKKEIDDEKKVEDDDISDEE